MSKQQELITRLTEAFEPHFLVVEMKATCIVQDAAQILILRLC